MILQQSHRSGRHSGIALIIVLLVITVLAILAGGFAYSMKVETQLARNASFDDDLFWVAWGGLEKAKYILAADLTAGCGPVDALKEHWAGGPGCNDPSQPPGIPIENRLVYEPGKEATWTIIDAERKFNINIAAEPFLQQAMMLIGMDPASHSTVIDSINDWMDVDRNARASGAEDDFYQGGQGPYGVPHLAKNGTIDDLSELLMINGVTRAMYEGSGMIDPTQPLAGNRAARSRFDEPIYSVGLRDLFCAVSSRILNVNTASETTLQVLPPVDANFAAEIVQKRAGPDGQEATSDDEPYRSHEDLAQRVPSVARILPQISQFIGYQSRVFEVTVEARIGGQHRTYVGLIFRNTNRDLPVLAFAPKWD